MSLSDILSITVPLGTTMLATAWWMGSRISMLVHRMDAMESRLASMEKGLDDARNARSNIWEKHNELTNRVTVVETKVS
jgi:predicted  nucleic acid-binding Zn-ribbon protein